MKRKRNQFNSIDNKTNYHSSNKDMKQNHNNRFIPSQPQSNINITTPTLAQLPQPETVHLSHSINQLVSQLNLPQLRCSASTDQTTGKSTATKVINKLGQLAPPPIIASSRASRFSASGHRQAAIPSSRIKPNCKIPHLVLTLSRRSSFTSCLKKALFHVEKFKASEITLMAMGCAISICFSLAMAIESNLQLGDSCRLVKSVTTGTVVVRDEIGLKDQTQDTDLIYQTRNQASIKIELRIEFIDQSKSITSKRFS